ncbi:MAG: zinc ribbon domain-containing protein [Candidatus Absconditabacterales bacterium]|nr:zinc ribbon domain-containing protein [Candidatus Absconditabacterales bacterium]
MLPAFINPASSPALILSIQILIGIVGFFWIIALLWTARDANARYTRQGGFWFALFLVTMLTPFIGLPLYCVIRPIKYKWDRDGEDRLICPSCQTSHAVQVSYCGSCGYHVKKTCHHCQAANFLDVRYCHACGSRFPSSS